MTTIGILLIALGVGFAVAGSIIGVAEAWRHHLDMLDMMKGFEESDDEDDEE